MASKAMMASFTLHLVEYVRLAFVSRGDNSMGFDVAKINLQHGRTRAFILLLGIADFHQRPMSQCMSL